MDNNISTQSKNCSKICRTIMIALIGLSWAEFHSNQSSKYINVLIISIILCVLYFLFDVIQYLYSYIKLRKLEFDSIYAGEPDDDNEKKKFQINYNDEYLKIEKRTFSFFIMKICLIPFVFIDLLWYFIWGR